jgi:hypothetical protein
VAGVEDGGPLLEDWRSPLEAAKPSTTFGVDVGIDRGIHR